MAARLGPEESVAVRYGAEGCGIRVGASRGLRVIALLSDRSITSLGGQLQSSLIARAQLLGPDSKPLAAEAIGTAPVDEQVEVPLPLGKDSASADVVPSERASQLLRHEWLPHVATGDSGVAKSLHKARRVHDRR